MNVRHTGGGMRSRRLGWICVVFLAFAVWTRTEAQVSVQSGPASATTSIQGSGAVQSLQSQIQALLAQLAELVQELKALQSQLQGLQPPPPNAPAAARVSYDQKLSAISAERDRLRNRISQYEYQLRRLGDQLLQLEQQQAKSAQANDIAKARYGLTDAGKRLDQAKALAANVESRLADRRDIPRTQPRTTARPAYRSPPPAGIPQ